MNRQHTTATSASRPHTTRRSWLRRGAVTALAGTSIAGALVLGGAGAALASAPPVSVTPTVKGAALASSSPVSVTPTFECYSGSMLIDKPQINENGGTVTWEPEIDRWANGKWVFVTYGRQQTVPNTWQGEVILDSLSFNTWHNTYFKVEDWFYTAATGWAGVQAQALAGGAPMFSGVCETS
jgi:hypothetical protein